VSEGKYRVILADPPWSFRVRNKPALRRGVATSHYRTLPLDAVKALPIASLASKNAALFLWSPMALLPEAVSCIEAWGFTYKTVAFNWVKLTQSGAINRKGLGHYTRCTSELCLIGTRGKVDRRARDVQQVILAKWREHSRKPDEQYERIMRLFDGPYLELFARQQWPGWDVWGNQAGKFPAQPFLFSESAAACAAS
jgi:N6-adenosine-specific RNA methylase IME4